MSKKFSLAIEIGGILKESFKSAVGASKSELKAVQRLGKIKIGAALDIQKEKLKSQLAGWKSVVGTAVSMGAPIIAGANFEFQMKRVKALANATGKDYEKLVNKAKELGATTQYSASEVGKSMEYLSMAGFKVGETLEATGGVLNLATVGNIDLGTSADIASNILSGFGMKAKEINKVVDVMAKTITSSNTSVTELGETMKYVAPVASKVGSSIEEVSAMTGLLANIGIKGSQAGTTLRAMFLRISAPTGEAARALATLGVRTKDAHGNIRPMTQILADLDKKMKLLPKSMRMQYLKSIFGEEAASGVSELLEKAGTGELQKYIKEIKDAKGAATKMVKEMNDTVLMRWKSVLSAVEGIFLTIYKPLEPILKFTLDVVVGGLRLLNKVLEFTAPVLSPVIFGFGSLFIASKLVAVGMTLSKIASLGLVRTLLMSLTPFGQVQKALKLLASQSVVTSNTLKASSLSLKGFFSGVKNFAFSALSSAKKAFFGIITASRTMGLALLTNPVFWIGAAIAGVGYLIYKNWDKLKYFFKGIWEGVKESFKPVIDAGKSIIEIFKPLGGLFGKIKNAIGSLFSNKEGLTNTGKIIGKTISIAFFPLIMVGKTIGWVVGLFKGISGAISEGFSPIGFIVEKVKGVFSIFSKLKTFVGSIFNGIGNIIKGSFSAASNFITNVLKNTLNIGKAILFGFAAAVKTVLLAPVKFIENIFGKVQGFIKAIKESPIGKLFSFGKNLIGKAVEKTKEVFSSKETKEKEVSKETSIKSVKESISETEKTGSKIDKLIGQFVLNINVNSKDVAKEIEKQAPNIKEQVLAILEEVANENTRQMRLSHGR